MHLRLRLVLLFLVFAFNAPAQNLLTSPRAAVEGQIFRLSEENARKAALQQVYEPDESWFNDRVATFSTNVIQSGAKDLAHTDLPPGHYLTSKVTGNQVEWSYKQVPAYSVFIENDDAHFMVKVMDFAGKIVTDARVTVADVQVFYDPATETYKAGPELERGLLEVHSAGMVQFYNLSKTIPQTRQNLKKGYPVWKRWLWWPVRRWVITPVWWTVKLPYDLVKSVVRKQPQGWAGWTWRWSRWIYYKVRHAVERKRPVNFMLTNQPKYRQGDTVKVKAYVTDRHGHPLHRKLSLMYTDRNGKTRTLAKFKPVHPGCYVTQFVLHDSLELHLGTNVNLVLDDAKRWKGKSLPQYQGDGYYYYKWYGQQTARVSTSFLYEDYELNQITFAMRAENTRHWKEKKAVLFLEAKDMNGLTVPDARVKVLATSGVVSRWEGDQNFLPDTLWYWTGNLDASGETRLEIPFDRFPTAAFNYAIQAECRTSDNELKTATLSMNYLYEFEEIVVRRQADTVRIALMRTGKEIPSEAQVDFFPRGHEGYPRTTWVTLPAKLYWPVNYGSMSVKTHNAFTSWSPSSDSKLQVYGQHTGDTLQIFASTSDTTAFTYHLFEADKEIATGTAKSWSIIRPAKPNKAYHLTIHRILNGTSQTDNYTYHWRKRDLKVDWEGPSTIYPGMTADMKVRIRNQRDKPIRKADVTAYAINSRFEASSPPSLPSASKAAKPRQREASWTAQSYADRSGRKQLIFENWEHRVGLDTLAWYHFLYPGDTIYRYYHPIAVGTAEIAPFVVYQGAIQPVQIVYVDAVPVYFAWTTPEVPYSFPISPGYHRIEMRTPEFGVKIDSFFVRTGFKTILSVDPEQLPRRHFYAAKMTHIPVGGEQQVINSYTFGYRGVGSAFPGFVQSGQRLFKVGQYSRGLAGPVEMRSKMEVDVVDQFKYSFDYEQGFEFDFGPSLLKMRSLQPSQYPTSFVYHPQQLVEHRPWVKDSLIAEWKRNQRAPTYRPETWDWRQNRGISHKGRLILNVLKTGMPASRVEYLAFLDDPKNIMYVMPYSASEQMSVPVGKWKMVLLLDNDQFVEPDSLLIREFGRNHYQIRIDSSQVQDSFSISHAAQIKQHFPDLRPKYSAASDPKMHYRVLYEADGSKPTKRLVGRVSDASTAEGLAGAMIICKGTSIGTITAEDGSFSFNFPADTDTLEVVYMGYRKRQIRWTGQQRLDIGLEEGDVLLDAVRINSQIQRSYQTDAVLSYSYSTSADIVNVPAMRNISAMNAISFTPGVMLSNGAPPLELGQMADPMTATVPAFPQELLDELAGKTVIRKDFRDCAVWEPSLRSDRKGLASFRVKFPEDITRWDAYALAVDRRGRTGITRSFIRAWKPIAGRLAMPRFLYEGDTAYVIGKVLNYTGDTIAMRRQFKQGEQVLSEKSGECGPLLLDTLAVTPNASQDSFTLTYVADKADGYGDGEQWGVRVFKQGIEQSDGIFSVLLGDTTLQLPKFEVARGPVKVRVASKLQQIFLSATQELADYEHLCNEQLASKLIALLAEQQIFKAMDSAWAKTENVNKVLAKLQERLNPNDQGWGWWPGMKSETWVSLHVTRALAQAKAMGYEFNIPYFYWSPSLLLRLNRKTPSANLETLQYVQQIDSTLDIHTHIESLDTAKYWSVNDRVAIMELRQKAHLSIDTDSLMRMSRRDLFGQRFWGNPNYYWQYAQGDILTTLAAFRILYRSGKSLNDLVPILAYILSQRNSGGWGNTFVTAQVLQTLIATVGRSVIDGKSKLELEIDGRLKTIPLDTAFTLTSENVPRLKKEGKGLTYFTAYQDRFNPNPHRIDSLFAVETSFTKDNVRIQSLTAGEPVKLNIHVEVKYDAEYMMLEIPIPASCSYIGSQRGYYDHYYNGYREYFRQKAVFYFRQLSKGNYNFQIELLPRYTGSYTLNATRIEHMYYPILAGQNEVERIKVQ